MQKGQKFLLLTLAAVIVFSVSFWFSVAQTGCCLCEASPCGSPCLVDLETGKMLELSLDGPCATANTTGITDVETFAFLQFGDVSGIKMTAPGMIELTVPVDGTVQVPDLCQSCQGLLPKGFRGKYVLADLSDAENIVLMPIAIGTEFPIQGYNITIEASERSGEVVLTVKANETTGD